MRKILVLLAVVVFTVLVFAPAANASRCGQYPTFIKPILCPAPQVE